MQIKRILNTITFTVVRLALALALTALAPSAAHSQTATVVPKGDVDGIAVMEFTGNYNANQPGSDAVRALVTNAFYQTHQDDYDFLVLLTNFNFSMPQAGTKAFYTGIRNDVLGTGQTTFDNSSQYGSAGRLQGLIELGNIANLVSDPVDPLFEETLTLLSHQLMHRWAADISFLPGGTGPASAALLSNDGGRHWSYLLDTNGSALYGNRWQDNGDGTFTSIEPDRHSLSGYGRVYSPLDLYLMGMIPAGQVPPMTLIENATIGGVPVSPGLLPQLGVTVSGTARSVTISDIIAATGARVPSAADSPKAFRTAFIYLTAPGTFPDTGLIGIDTIRNEWAGRFSVLTDGSAMMEATVPTEDSLPSNPGYTPPDPDPINQPSIDAGVDWLMGQQYADYRWQDQSTTALRDTAAAVRSLKPFIVAQTNYVNGLDWLATAQAENTDYLARKIEALAGGGRDVAAFKDELMARWNGDVGDGGWGSKAGYASNGLDTGLALRALAAAGYPDDAIVESAVNFLLLVQNSDGGWSVNSHKNASASSIQATATVLSAMNAYRNGRNIDVQMAAGTAWLLSRQNTIQGDPDFGGFGPSTGSGQGNTVYDTALAVSVLKTLGVSADVTNNGMQYLRSRQNVNGSWGASAYQTGLAVEALWKNEVAVDLTVTTADIAFAPDKEMPVPTTVVVTATVRNLGSTNAGSVQVALYEGDPGGGIPLGNQLGIQSVTIDGNSAVPVTFTVTASADGLYPYTVVVDPDNLVQEASDWNNSATKYLNVNVALPVVGFETAATSFPESAGTVPVSVVINRSWPNPVTINWTVNPSSTASLGTDYSLNSGTLTFSPNESAKAVSFALVNDDIAEYDETVTLDLTVSAEAASGLSGHTLTITDDGDQVPSVKILSPSGGTIGTRTPLLQYIAAPANATVTVTIAVGGGTPAAINKVSGDNLDSLQDGTYTLIVTATNGTYTGSDSVTFTVDTDPPVVTMKSPVEGVYSNDQIPLVYSVDKQATVTVMLDGSAVTLPDGSPLPSGSTLTALAEGGHTIRVEATTAPGIAGSAEAYFVVSTAPEPAYIDVWKDNLPPISISNQKQSGGVATDAHGSVYTVGVVDSSTYPDGTYFIAKYDPRGNMLWSDTKSSTMDIYVGDIAVDSEGSAYFVAYTRGELDGCEDEICYGGYCEDICTNQGYDDSYLVKYDTHGNHSWTKKIGKYSYDLYLPNQVHCVAVDKNDFIYVGGVTRGELYGPTFYQDIWALFVGTFTKSGGQFGGGLQIGISSSTSTSLGSDKYCDLALDSDGNILLGARTERNFQTSDYLFAKYGGEDTLIISSGMPGADKAYGIAVDSLGNAYLTGTFTAKYDPAGVLVIPAQTGGGYAIAAERNGNIFTTGSGFVRKADSDLNQRWSWSMPQGGGTGRGIALDGNGDVFVASNNGATTYLYKLHDTRLPSVALDHWSFKTNNSAPAVTGTMDEGAEITVIPSGNATAGPVTYPTPTTWQCTLGGLVEGANTITVVAKNNAGFKYKVYGEIILDTVPPVVTLTSPVSGQNYAAKPDLIYSVSGGTARITVNGVEIIKESGHPIDCLRPGINTVRIEARDEAGNEASAEATFEVSGSAAGELPYITAMTRQAGTTANDSVFDMAKDQSGNIYLAGRTHGLFDTNTTSQSPDAFVLKYDTAGTRTSPAWQFDAGYYEEANGIALDSGGNVYLVQTEHFAQEGNKGWTEILVSKYDENKTPIWNDREYGSSSTDYATGIAVDNAGNAIITGYTYGKFQNAQYGNDGQPDYFVAKVNGSSNPVWKYQSGVAGHEIATAIAVDASGNAYVTGNKGGSFVTKINSNGSFAWEKSIIAGTGSGYGIAVDTNNYIFVVGSVDQGNGNNMFLAKYDQSGTLADGYPVVLNSAGDDVGRALALDAAGNIYVGGYTSGNFDGNISLGGYDLFVAKFDSAGNKLWSGQWGTPADDYLSGIELDGGSIILGGYTAGSMEGTNAGSYDAFIMRLAAPAPLPTITIDPVATPTYSASQTISGTMTGGENVSVSVSTGAAGICSGAENWSCTINNLKYGDNVIYARAADGTGRFATAAATIEYRDDVPPVVVITLPAPGVTNDFRPELAYTVFEENTYSVTVKVDDQIVRKVSGDRLDALMDGGHTVLVEATDAAGYYGSDSVDFTVKSLVPSFVHISSGKGHTMMLRSDGTLWAVGENGYGQLGDGTGTSRSFPVRINEPNDPDTRWKAVAAGWQHTLAIKDDDTLWAWGYNGYGQSGRNKTTYNNWSAPYMIDGGAWKTVAAGWYHSLAADSNGNVWSWGNNTYGQLGDGFIDENDPNPSHIKRQVDGIAGIVSLAGGMHHSLALQGDGTLYTWGRNNVGQVGNNNLVNHLTPYLLGTGWSKIAAGGHHSLALDSNGKLYAWGFNPYGQVGDNSTTNRYGPTPIGNEVWSRISAGVYHSAAIRSDGTLWAWGLNDQGQISGGVTGNQKEPVQVGADADWIEIAAGHYHNAAIKSNGTLWAWGNNAYGVTGRTSPTPVTGGGLWNKVAAGQWHSLGISSGGTLWSWGLDNGGQLGDDDVLKNSSVPVSVKTDHTGETSWTAVAAGSMHSLAIGSNGTLWAWGSNAYGQAGDGTSSNNRTTPVHVNVVDAQGQPLDPQPAWDSVAAGTHHSVGLTSAGELYTWGYNSDGQIGNGTTSKQETPYVISADRNQGESGRKWSKITSGSMFILAIRDDHTLWGWGRNNTGQLGIGNTTSPQFQPGQVTIPGRPDEESTWTAVSAGTNHVLAIHTDGTLWAWGSGGYYQLGNELLATKYSPIKIFCPAEETSCVNNGWVAVSAGQWYSLALQSNGDLYGWGYNDQGQLGMGSTTMQSTLKLIAPGTAWTGVSAMNFHTLGIRSDGTLWSWGYDAFGQLGDGAPVDRSLPRQVETVLVINNGEWSVTSEDVILTLAPADTGDIQAMEICNSGGSCSTVEPYAATVPWMLDSGDGEKTVTVRFRDAAGNWSGMFSDTILLDRSLPLGGVSINTGAQYANNSQVTLDLSTTGIIGAAYMRFSNDGITWEDPVQYSGSVPWLLAAGDGEKTVYVQFQDGAGKWSYSYGDTIVLDTAPPEGIVYTRVATGANHVLALKSDGTLWAWGSNDYGQLGDGTKIQRNTPVRVGNGGDTWIAVASRNITSYAIRSDGTLWAWGYDGNGELGDNVTLEDKSSPRQVGSESNWFAVSAGNNHAAAINDDGELYVWGSNAFGQLGVGTGNSAVPVLVNQDTDWEAVAAGGNHTLALKSNGSVWAWGYNAYGQVGDGTVQDRATPYQEIGSGIQLIAAGGNHSLAIGGDGTLWAWGYNKRGQLGLGNTTNKTSPQQVGTGTDWTAIAAGVAHTLAVRSGGSEEDGLYAWGYNYRGELGDGTTAQGNSPVRVSTDTGWTELAGSNYKSAAVKADGTLWIWGDDVYGAINRTVPAQVGADTGWASASGGEDFSVARKNDGTLWTWGNNYYGTLGDNTHIDQSQPVQIGPGSTWSMVEAGDYHVAALDVYNRLWTWGLNNKGQLGDGTVLNSIEPKEQTIQPGPWKKIAAGHYYTAAIRQDDTLWTWGENNFGQLGDGTTTNSSVPAEVRIDGNPKNDWITVSAGKYHTAALDSGGMLWTWGYNGEGQLGIGTRVSEPEPQPVHHPDEPNVHWTAVATGSSHTVALDSNGQIWTWGYNAHGQLGSGDTTRRELPYLMGSITTPNSGWVAVATGKNNTLALKSDGTLWGWGFNAYGELGDGTTTDRPAPVQVGEGTDWSGIFGGNRHTLAVKSDGTLWAWGNNGYGQLGDGRAQHELSPALVDTEGSIIINNGDQTTNSVSVTLTLLASDATPDLEVELSNDGQNWSNPTTYAETTPWTLDPGEGMKTVFVRFRDAAGNWSGVFSDTILLDTAGP